MASSLSLTLLFFLLFSPRFLSADPPEHPPTPAPQSGDDSPSPAHCPGAHGTPSPSPSDSFHSPPSPPPSDLSPSRSPPSPSPAPSPSNSTPTPAPVVASDVSRAADITDSRDEPSDGMNGGQKAGIAIGVIAGACVVGFGGMLYRKRQQNIRRAQYGFAARRDIL